MNSGIVICSRLTSKRVPSKAIIPINSKPALWWLLKRLETLKIPVVLAVPHQELSDYISMFQQEFKDVKFFSGSENNVLERMYKAAKLYQLDPVVRITHDDIIIDVQLLKQMLGYYEVAQTPYRKKCTYMCCSKVTEGAAAEIISFKNIEDAYLKHPKLPIEHISYFVKQNKEECIDHSTSFTWLQNSYRLSLDYPKDHLLLEILARSTDFLDTRKILEYVAKNEHLLKINALPKITIFITAYNGSQYLKAAIESIRNQTFKDFEFYFLDDGSTDDSLRIAARYEDVKILVNSKNKGIAHSSNRVLERARGKYIIRLDADDILMPTALENLHSTLENNSTWAVCYSGYYETDDKLNIIKEVDKNFNHHIAGSLISKKALNELKFKEGLKHFDSQELYQRIKNSFDYGYIMKPLFMYRQHGASWSHTAKNLEARVKVKRDLNL